MPVSINNTQIVFNDGTTQTTAASASSYIGDRGQVFTSSGTFTIPTGITALKVTVAGGGGGGGSGNDNGEGGSTGGTGGGGGGAIKFLTGLTPGATLSVTVGAGGNSGSSGGTSSVASGNQSISTISATGGGGGGNGNPGTNGTPAAGGAGSGGDVNVTGPGFGAISSYSEATQGCSSVFGLGRFGSVNFSSLTTNGNAGAGFAAGGGGARRYQSGGNSGGVGTAGIVIFEW